MNLQWPIKGISLYPPIAINPGYSIYISQGFADNPALYAQFGLKGHNGIDIAAPLDTKIYAPHDGSITFENDTLQSASGGYGLDIRLTFTDSGQDWECIFGHLHKYEGQPRNVKRGDLIGYVDSTGFSTGNHLHFGVRKLLNGSVVDYNNGYFGYIDPLKYLKGDRMLVFFQVKNTQTIWALMDGQWVGFADYNAFTQYVGGRQNVVLQLDQAEFAKLNSNPDVFKT